MEYITLNNGIKMPKLGYGVYQTPPEDTKRCVLDAIEVGYRSIDTAQAYNNMSMCAVCLSLWRRASRRTQAGLYLSRTM